MNYKSALKRTITNLNKVKKYSGKVQLVCGKVNIWYALSLGKLHM